MLRGGLAGGQAGDPQHRDRGPDLLRGVLAAVLLTAPDLPDGVPLDQEDLPDVRESQVSGGIHDLDGPGLLAAVPGPGGLVRDGDRRPVQGVQPFEEAFLVSFRDHYEVGEEFLADEDGVGADGVPGVHGQHPPGEVQAAQQRLELRDLICFRADQPLGDHHGLAVGGGGQQVRDHPVRPDRAPHRLAVDREGREHDRPGDRESNRRGPGPGHQVRPGLIGQVLRPEQREDPLHGIGVRRPAVSRAGTGVQRGEQFARGAADPRGDIGQGHAPGQDRRDRQAQDHRQRMADPPPAPGIRHRREATRQVTAARPVQVRRPADQDRRGGLRRRDGNGNGHGRLDAQRGSPGFGRFSQTTRPTGAPSPISRRSAAHQAPI